MSRTDDYQEIRVDVDGALATVTLHRPEQHNAWTLTMNDEVGEAMATLDADDSVRVVIITGAGNSYCVGADMAGRDLSAPGTASAHTPTRTTRPPEMCKPVIAAMNGNSAGIGVTYPMLCDLRIVAEDAKVTLPFVRRALVGELGSNWILPRLVGFATAVDLLLTGRVISGAEAARIGLCTRAVPRAEVLPTARAIAEDLAVHAAPASVAATKRLLWESLEQSFEDSSAREVQLFSWLAKQPDALEGVTSFLDRRDPEWSLTPSTPLPQPPQREAPAGP
jgi:enoyl-CoA hydratase/carnithine racemase